MTESGSRDAIERVWARVLADPRNALERDLDPSDLHTLQLDVARARAAAVTPARLMQRWQHGRYVRPSSSDPRQIWRTETRLWELLPDQFERIDLSPVTPLGTCSAVAPVDQHRVITTIRGSEVVSDQTNVLALQAALQRKRNPTQPVHLAACHRVIRAQPFRGEGLFQHFRIFALLSSARDRGSASAEAAMLIDHLRYWIHAITTIVRGVPVRAEFTSFGSAILTERFHDTVLGALQPLPELVSVSEDPTRDRARGYYDAGAIRISIGENPAVGEIGDGGFTNWTGQLMTDKKERCLISCIATERLAALVDGHR
jgi:hypothetical protein